MCLCDFACEEELWRNRKEKLFNDLTRRPYLYNSATNAVFQVISLRAETQEIFNIPAWVVYGYKGHVNHYLYYKICLLLRWRVLFFAQLICYVVCPFQTDRIHCFTAQVKFDSTYGEQVIAKVIYWICNKAFYTPIVNFLRLKFVWMRLKRLMRFVITDRSFRNYGGMGIQTLYVGNYRIPHCSP